MIHPEEETEQRVVFTSSHCWWCHCVTWCHCVAAQWICVRGERLREYRFVCLFIQIQWTDRSQCQLLLTEAVEGFTDSRQNYFRILWNWRYWSDVTANETPKCHRVVQRITTVITCSVSCGRVYSDKLPQVMSLESVLADDYKLETETNLWRNSRADSSPLLQDTLTHLNLWRSCCIVGNVHSRFRQERRMSWVKHSVCFIVLLQFSSSFMSDMIPNVKLSSFLNLLVWFLCRKTSRRSRWSIRTRSSGCRRNTHFS